MSTDASQSSPNTTSQSVNVVGDVISKILLFLVIFGMSATVHVRNLKQQLRNRTALLTGLAMQFFVMPLLGYIAVLALQDRGLTFPMGISLLMVTSSPGGSYSNWWCSMFNADLSLSVAMTALSTVLSIVFLPANLTFYAWAAYSTPRHSRESTTTTTTSDGSNIIQNVDFVALFAAIAVVIVAILSGIYCSSKFDTPKFHRRANALGSVSGIALIVFSAVVTTSTGQDEDGSTTTAKPWQQDWSFYVGVGLPCIAGLIIANLVSMVCCPTSKVTKPEVVAISVECCYQNVGIATSAAFAMFDTKVDRAQALSVPLFMAF